MKLKTHQASNKRFRRTNNDKFIKRKNGQGHFNSRERGNSTRNKRTDFAIDNTVGKELKALNPYNV